MKAEVVTSTRFELKFRPCCNQLRLYKESCWTHTCGNTLLKYKVFSIRMFSTQERSPFNRLSSNTGSDRPEVHTLENRDRLYSVFDKPITSWADDSILQTHALWQGLIRSPRQRCTRLSILPAEKTPSRLRIYPWHTIPRPKSVSSQSKHRMVTW